MGRDQLKVAGKRESNMFETGLYLIAAACIGIMSGRASYNVFETLQKKSEQLEKRITELEK